jgi:hypothetical protein
MRLAERVSARLRSTPLQPKADVRGASFFVLMAILVAASIGLIIRLASSDAGVWRWFAHLIPLFGLAVGSAAYIQSGFRYGEKKPEDKLGPKA